MSLPRHYLVICSARCGYQGQRNADSKEDACRRGCPRCASAVVVRGAKA